MCKENELEVRYVVDWLLLIFKWFNNYYLFINYYIYDIFRNGNLFMCCYNSYYNGLECVCEYLIIYLYFVMKFVKDLF